MQLVNWLGWTIVVICVVLMYAPLVLVFVKTKTISMLLLSMAIIAGAVGALFGQASPKISAVLMVMIWVVMLFVSLKLIWAEKAPMFEADEKGKRWFLYCLSHDLRVRITDGKIEYYLGEVVTLDEILKVYKLSEQNHNALLDQIEAEEFTEHREQIKKDLADLRCAN